MKAALLHLAAAILTLSAGGSRAKVLVAYDQGYDWKDAVCIAKANEAPAW
jgi:hypothetical protein